MSALWGKGIFRRRYSNWKAHEILYLVYSVSRSIIADSHAKCACFTERIVTAVHTHTHTHALTLEDAITTTKSRPSLHTRTLRRPSFSNWNATVHVVLSSRKSDDFRAKTRYPVMASPSGKWVATKIGICIFYYRASSELRVPVSLTSLQGVGPVLALSSAGVRQSGIKTSTWRLYGSWGKLFKEVSFSFYLIYAGSSVHSRSRRTKGKGEKENT